MDRLPRDDQLGFGAGLRARAGYFLRVAALAAVLTAAVSWAIPAHWESTVALLPPERRTDAFRYTDGGEGGSRTVRRLMRAFRLTYEAHPLDIWDTVLGSEQTARQLVRRFGLVERWNLPDEQRAAWRVQDSMTVEDVPYGCFEITFRTRDAQLSADLANAAVEILEQRMRDLYRRDVEWEREFLEQAAEQRAEDAVRAEARLVAAGWTDREEEERSARAAAARLARDLVEARIEHAAAKVRYGEGSPQERDAAARARETARVAALLPLPVTAPGEASLDEERRELEETAALLAGLRSRTYEHQATHDQPLRVLDPAVPGEDPERPFLAALLIALVFVPVPFTVGHWAPRLAAGLPAEIGASFRPWGAAARRARDAAPPTLRILASALLAAGAGLLFARYPLALAGILGLVYLVILAFDVRAGWLTLIIALPWAWIYINERARIAIQFPTEPGIILLVGAWIYARLLRPRPWPRGALFWWILAMPVWMAITAVTSVNLRNATFQVISVTGFILAGALFPMIEMRRVREVERVVGFYLISGALLSVWGILQVIQSPLPFNRAAFYIGQGLLHDHGPYTAFLGFALGPALVYLMNERWSLRTLPVLLSAILMTMATVISLTRGAWLATAGLLFVLGMVRARLFLRKMLVPLLIAGAVLVPAFLRSPAATQGLQEYWRVSTSKEYTSNVERLNRWLAGVRMVIDRPLLGVGPGCYEDAYEQYRDVDFDRARRGSHMEILRAASEQGIPGLVILAGVVTVFFRTGIRLARHARDPRIRTLAAGLAAGMFTYAIHGQVNEYFRLPKIAITIWVFAGMMAALDRMDREGEEAPDG